MDFSTPGIALVTGASKGIGKATALAFASAGASGLILTARNEDELRSVAAEAKGRATNQDFKTLVVVADITSEKDIQMLIEKSIDTLGRIDYAANVAGIIAGPFEQFDKTSTDVLDHMYDMNQKPTFVLTREQLKVMKTQEPLQTSLSSDTRPPQRGSIVNVSSTIAQCVPKAKASAYVASKYAVNGLSKVAAADHACDGIRVNTILPGYTITEGLQAHPAANAELLRHFENNIAMQRLGSPEEIADVIVFLCSPRASYVTGASWVVDGGFSVI